MAINGEGRDLPELDAIRIETLMEVGNIFINGVMGSIGNVLGQQITYLPPVYVEDTMANIVRTARFDPDERVLLANTRFYVEDINVEGIIAMILEIGSLDTLLEKIAVAREGESTSETRPARAWEGMDLLPVGPCNVADSLPLRYGMTAWE